MEYIQNDRDLLRQSELTIQKVNKTNKAIEGILSQREIEDIANRVELVEGGGSISSSGIEIVENEDEDRIDIGDIPEPHSSRIHREQKANPREKPTWKNPIPNTPEEFFNAERAERSRLRDRDVEVETMAW